MCNFYLLASSVSATESRYDNTARGKISQLEKFKGISTLIHHLFTKQKMPGTALNSDTDFSTLKMMIQITLSLSNFQNQYLYYTFANSILKLDTSKLDNISLTIPFQEYIRTQKQLEWELQGQKSSSASLLTQANFLNTNFHSRVYLPKKELYFGHILEYTSGEVQSQFKVLVD